MKKIFFISIFLTVILNSSSVHAMAEEVPEEKIEMLERLIDTAYYKDDLIISYDDRTLFMLAPAHSRAGKLYQKYSKLFGSLPSRAEMKRGKNWAEQIYAEHLHKIEREKMRSKSE